MGFVWSIPEPGGKFKPGKGRPLKRPVRAAGRAFCKNRLTSGTLTAYFCRKRMRMVATSQRRAEPAGDRVVSVEPVIRPSDTAH